MRKRRRTKDDESSEGEEFDFDAMEVDESDSEVALYHWQASQAKSKVKKSGVRGDIDAMTDDLRSGGGGKRERKKAKVDSIQTQTRKFAPIDVNPKKYADAGLRTNVKAKSATKDGEKVIGGLSDGDADGERPEGHQKVGTVPKVQFPAKLERDSTRKNEVAGMLVEAQNEPPPKKLAPVKKTAKNKPTPAQKVSQPDDSAQDTDCNKGGDVADSFLEDPRWKTTFLPSIAHAFYISSQPFKHFSVNSPVFLQTVQKVFDASFPDVNYQIKSKSVIITKAYERIKSRRSFIASDAIEEVKKFFDASDYKGKKDEISKYALWALRGDGPGYNSKPTPSDCKVKSGEDGYIEPDGIFQSCIMTSLGRKYIKHSEDSVYEPPIGGKNPPKGLYALIAAAVERAFGAYRRGIYKKPDAFSDEKNGSAIEFFKNKGEVLSERHWKVIIADIRSEAKDDGESENEGDLSVVSIYREAFCIPKSPTKAQTS